MKDQWFVSCEDMADKAVEVGAFYFVYLNYFNTQNIVSVGYEFFFQELDIYAQTVILIAIHNEQGLTCCLIEALSLLQAT